MPEATDELRALMLEYFGSEVGDAGPTAYLKVRGWKESTTGFWESPIPLERVSQKEFECILFLIQEWDHDYSEASGREQ